MNNERGFTALELAIVLAILAILVGIVAMSFDALGVGVLTVHADSGTETRLVGTTVERDAMVADGWTYKGVVRLWPGRTMFCLERYTLAWELWQIETDLLNAAEYQSDGTFVVSAEAMTAFTEDIERAVRRAGKEGR